MCNILYVTNNNDFGDGSFRDCLMKAQPLQMTQIIFSIEPTDTITCSSDLPSILNDTLIMGNNVTINFNGYNGLIVTGINNAITELNLTGSKGNGITILGNANTVIKCNIYGNGANGIEITGAEFNVVGNNLEHVSSAVSNVCYDNKGNGIKLNNAHNNIIQNNYFGVLNDGSTGSGNGENGVYITNSSSNNIIGGKQSVNNEEVSNVPVGDVYEITRQPTYTHLILGNVISGNTRNGVLIDNNSTNNTFYFNSIGSCYLGLTAVPNLHNGISIVNAHRNKILGTNERGGVAYQYYNIISANKLNGISIESSNGTIIRGNYIGINYAYFTNPESTMLPNGRNGIVVLGDSNNTLIGGQVPNGNSISGNNKDGIRILIHAGNKFFIYNNYCGLFPFSDKAAPNKQNGVKINISNPNGIFQPRSNIITNTFSGNGRNGITILGDSSHIAILSLYCGISNLSKPLPNGNNGVVLRQNAHNIKIGTAKQSVQVVTMIGCNKGNGIVIGGNSHRNKITDSYIGTMPDLAQLGNEKNGLCLNGKSSNCIVRKNCLGYNQTNGIILLNKTKNNKIVKNFVGVAPPRGKQAVPNRKHQILNMGRLGRNNINSNIIRNNKILQPSI